MPVGVMVNVSSVVLGGIFGAVFGHKLKPDFTSKLTMVFGVCSFGMGMSSVVLMENMPAVIFSIVMGTAIGLTMHLGEWIEKGAVVLQKPIASLFKGKQKQDETSMSMLVTIMVLFCVGSTGIYGTLVSSMTGDHSILISKSILDFFTAAIFACQLGFVVSLIAIPQSIIMGLLFVFAQVIFPYITPIMLADFKACGGFLMLATGLRIANIKDFPIADMLPAMVFVMPLSWLWVTYMM